MIDTHCHLTFQGLSERVYEVVSAAHDAGVDRMITVGTDPDDAARAIELAERFDGVYATAGVHPHHAGKCQDIRAMTAALRELAEHPKVVALGEMGLDYHYDEPPPEAQKRVFAAQLELMHDFRGPGVIHNREATGDVAAMIRECGLQGVGERFVFHCFTVSPGCGPEEVDAILDLGAMVSFTGIVTFRNAIVIAEASDRVPLDRLMIETDSPYLTPEPHRKVRPNEPRYVVHVAEFLAQRRGMGLDDFVAAVDNNAERFFNLKRETS